MPRWVHADDVRSIRRYHGAGYTITALAKRFKLSRQCVSAIVHRRTHANVTMADTDSLPPLSSVPIRTTDPPLSPDDSAAMVRRVVAASRR